MSLFLTLNKKLFLEIVYASFFGSASKAKATSRRRFTYYHKVPRNSWKVPGNFILCFTVSVVDFEQVNAHRIEACHTFHISTICKKTLDDSHMLHQSIKLSHMQSCNKRKLQTARAHTLLLNLSKWFFVLLDLYKTMTFLGK